MDDSTNRRSGGRGWSLAAIGLLAAAAVVAVGLRRGTAPFSLRENPDSPPVVRRPPPTVSRLAEPDPAQAAAPGSAARADPLAPQNLRRRIKLGIDYLVRACGPDGRFVYRVHLDPATTPPPRYNVLRHAGAMVALGWYHEVWPDEEVRAALVRAGAFLKRECVAPVPGREDLLAVWSPPDLVVRDRPLEAKLGGAGLGLVGLLMVERAAPGSTPPEDLRRLGRFLVWMQKEDGGFYSKLIPASGGRSDEFTSLYYPGEAALALVMLYEHDGSQRWLHSAANALGYLARSRQGAAVVPADHWALIATARLLPLYDRAPMPVSRELLIKHAVQICRQMVGNLRPRPDDSPLAGCFTDDGRTSPTATQVEGLLAALAFLPHEEEPFRKKIKAAAGQGLKFLLRAQVTSGKYAGGVPRGIRLRPADYHRGDLDQFNAKGGEIRIDYVQHACSAMMAYRRLFASEPSEPDEAGQPHTPGRSGY